MRRAGYTLLVLATLAVPVWIFASLWSECRTDHSVFYCLRVLGK